VLLVTVGLHFAAALYHQFVLKDRLLRRMMFKRFPD
jgi:cytochrome b561